MVMWNSRALFAQLKNFWRSKRGNVAIIFGLSLVPITVAAGAGLDLARATMVRERMTQALDAAGLAVGGASGTGLSQSQLQTLAQQYFNANYKEDKSLGTPASISVTISGKTATLSSSVAMPTVLVRLADLVGCTKCDTMNVPVSDQIVWGKSKLWVSLVLDNTGSMTQTDSTGTSKISALKTGANQLLTILQNAAQNPGDVQVAIVPFSKDINVGTSNVSASWIDWTDWQAAPPNSTPSSSVGPGSSCPYSTFSKGYGCQADPSNGSSSTTTIPSSGTYTGYICPSQDSGSVNTGRGGHYYNGCYNSVKQNSGCRTSCLYNHTWISNAHSTWGGCIEDRSQSYDVTNTAPGSGTNFPAENAVSCPPATVMALNYNWSNLSSEINGMQAQGSTNQTIGLAWGWQAQTPGTPLSPPTLPQDTQQYLIILSDGLNTQDRWYGDGANQSTSVDARMGQVCTNAKAAGYVVYTIFVDLNGTQGNSAPLQNCATDPSKYFILTNSGAIITTLNQIAEDIINLRVSK
jgi:Flp pilus assembly protein TadG